MLNYPNMYPMQTPQGNWGNQGTWGTPQYDNRVANVGSLVANVGAQSSAPTKAYLKALPVTSVDEAKAAMIDLDGSMFVFVNVGAGEIYTKQYNLSTGASDFQMFKAFVPNQQESGYASVESLKELRESMERKFNELSEKFKEVKEMKSNAKSNPNYANVTDSKK